MENLRLTELEQANYNENVASIINYRNKFTSYGVITVWMKQNGRKPRTFGFNFDPKPIGYTETLEGIKRTVVAIC